MRRQALLIAAIGIAGVLVVNPFHRPLEVRETAAGRYNDPPPEKTDPLRVRGGTLSLRVPKRFVQGAMGGSTRNLVVRWRAPLWPRSSDRKLLAICGVDDPCPVGRDGDPGYLTFESAGPGRARLLNTHEPGVKLITPPGATEPPLRGWIITVGDMEGWRWALSAAILGAAGGWLRVRRRSSAHQVPVVT